MSTITKQKITKRTVKRTLTKQQKIDKLVKEIEEARKELKEGRAIEGTAEEIIRYLRNEVKKSK